ncbi:hypothetical protein J7L02_00640 [Candidatus Woesearchaeota archaeon]|nr:hypothetical protein [Candidatus Woesearchaeota archaeon]
MAKPPFYKIVDTLYNTVMKHAPEALQKRPMLSAFVLGGTGSYALTRLGQGLASKLGLNNEDLENLEKALMTAATAMPLSYAATSPESAKQIMQEHPVYSSGMLGLYFGLVNAILKDLKK